MLVFFIVNYSWLDALVVKSFDLNEEMLITRVIDGDTVEGILDEEKVTVRLLGINTPERGEWLYSEAKEFLEVRILNKTVSLEFGKDKTDKYGRTLAYLNFRGENVNVEIVRNGLGNFYFPSGKDRYYQEFYSAWEECLVSERGLCEKSKSVCSKCIILEEFNVRLQKIVFVNNCNFICNLEGWTVKDEGRKKFVFENLFLDSSDKIEIRAGNSAIPGSLHWKESYVWTNSGDSLFLRDENNKLILWKSY